MADELKPPPGRRWLTVDDVAKLLDIAPDIIRRLSDKGKLLPLFKSSGGHRRFHPEYVSQIVRVPLHLTYKQGKKHEDHRKVRLRKFY